MVPVISKPPMTDTDLLHRFVTQRDQSAFTELVRRNLNLVYAAALRHVGGDKHRAEDVAQQVFIDLARKAPVLAGHPNLAGWLYAGTRFTAIDTIRGEQRRTRREQSAELTQATDTLPEPHWDRIRPVIDDVLLELEDEDRQSVLLRFFGQQTFAAIGQQLGMTENAAQKRVDRALDRLNAALVRRGITSTATVLGVALARGGVTAPTGLGASVTAAALGTLSVVGAANISLMTAAKVVMGLGTAAFCGYWGGVWQEGGIAADVAEANRSEWATKLSAAETKLAAAEVRVRAERKSAEVAEAETATLLNEIERARIARAAATTPPAAPDAPKAGQVYVVKPGDTGLKIARNFGIAVAALREANVDYDFARMRVGDQVIVPQAAIEQAAVGESGYVVVAGDTARKIAATAGLSVEQVRALNPEIDWTRLKIGQAIKVR